jgi:hypothetical protein
MLIQSLILSRTIFVFSSQKRNDVSSQSRLAKFSRLLPCNFPYTSIPQCSHDEQNDRISHYYIERTHVSGFGWSVSLIHMWIVVCKTSSNEPALGSGSSPIRYGLPIKSIGHLRVAIYRYLTIKSLKNKEEGNILNLSRDEEEEEENRYYSLLNKTPHLVWMKYYTSLTHSLTTHCFLNVLVYSNAMCVARNQFPLFLIYFIFRLVPLYCFFHQVVSKSLILRCKLWLLTLGPKILKDWRNHWKL